MVPSSFVTLRLPSAMVPLSVPRDHKEEKEHEKQHPSIPRRVVTALSLGFFFFQHAVRRLSFALFNQRKQDGADGHESNHLLLPNASKQWGGRQNVVERHLVRCFNLRTSWNRRIRVGKSGRWLYICFRCPAIKPCFW